MSRVIALAGNPNCGKTTLFNRLTGSSQKVGNWPGVTIDRKEGRIKAIGAVLVDLPGIYSLSPYSPEEVVSRDFLLDSRPDAIINIVDATNMERNLYLTSQILDMGIPTVIALNMMDTVRRDGTVIDTEKLSKALGCRVVGISAFKGEGMDELLEAISSAGETPKPVRLSDLLEKSISEISGKLEGKVPDGNLRWYSVKALERDVLAIERIGEAREEISEIIDGLEKAEDDESDSLVASERYSSISEVVVSSVKTKRASGGYTTSDRIDRIVTNRWLGLPIFAGVMFLVYYISITTVGGWGTDWVNDVFFGEWTIPVVAGWLEGMAVDPVLSAFIVDGLIAGVGAVLGFLPQMLVLFVLLVILEDSGYMARIAFVMDRVFRRFGLSGKSFIPILIGTGCGVPGIMASRTIESERDRRITAMTTTFIPCSAKLPIIALIAGALFGGSALVASMSYFIGVLAILLSGIILKKWPSLSGTPSEFIMELPPYHVPGIATVIRSTFEKGWAFVRKAGTFILLACGIVWFLSAFDWSMSMVGDINDSMLADIGNAITWIFVPLGWGDEWQFSVGTITGLLAKENVVGTFGVLFGFSEVAESGDEIWPIIASMLTPIAGFSFLVFNLLCAPCFAAIGAMRRELGTWKATGAAVLYQCLLAYAVSMVIFQIGSLLIYGTFGIWTVAAFATVALAAYILVSKEPFARARQKISEAAA